MEAVSYCDDVTDREPEPDLLTPSERRLLGQRSWTHEELITLAFIARRLADRLDRALGRSVEVRHG